MIGMRKPKKAIPGMVVAGEVEAVGKEVKRFQRGDQVFAYDITRFSTYAEYTCLPENSAIAFKPSTVTYEEAAAIPFGGITALHFLKQGKIHSGQHLLIYGASGSVGTWAVQFAKHFGALVTGVCSTTNVALVKSLGADQVIDYTKEDWTRSGETYDMLFDAVGKTSFPGCLRSLKKDGVYLQPVAPPALSLQMLWAGVTSSRTLIGGAAPPKTEDLMYLKELVEVGKIKPVIDDAIPWSRSSRPTGMLTRDTKREMLSSQCNRAITSDTTLCAQAASAGAAFTVYAVSCIPQCGSRESGGQTSFGADDLSQKRALPALN
jgi:NADPH:quinone reductase-like Zn-dependent oxidoreductase